MIEGYMFGDYESLYVIARHKNGSVSRLSAGSIPEFVSSNDSTFTQEKRK